MQCMDRTALKQMLDEGLSLAEIGRRVGRHESTVAYWMVQHGLEANGRERHAAKGAIDRERLEVLVNDGLSAGQIAESVGRSKTTARHWLREYGLTTAWGCAGARPPRGSGSSFSRARGTDLHVPAAEQGWLPLR
jgi:transposase